MSEETLMTDAATTTESAPASQPAAEPATAAVETAQQTDGLATDAAPAAEAKAEDKPQGAPEAYEFTPPEGREFNPETLAAFSDAARELGMSQEAAQKVLDKIAPALAAKQETALADARKQWGETTRNDQEIGGTNLEANVALANKTFQDFGTPELRKLLDDTGLGDHPELIRWAHRVGKAMSEDSFVAGRGASAASADPAKRMFPNMA